ncbi:hypothetical protein CSE899_17442, partial [Cronobacter sakazakii E899]
WLDEVLMVREGQCWTVDDVAIWAAPYMRQRARCASRWSVAKRAGGGVR